MNMKIQILLLGFLLAVMSAGAINYPTYEPRRSSSSASFEQEPLPLASPYSAEQLTSPSLSSTPMIGDDGVAIEPCAAAPRQSTGHPGGNAGTGDTGRDETTYQPVGDAILPLLLMALAYALTILLRNIHLKHKQSYL